MSDSKLLALVKGLTLSQKRDLKVFAEMPLNRLMSKDRIALEELLSLNAQTLKEPERVIWDKLFNQEPPAEQNRVKTRLFQMMERYVSLYQLNQHTGIKLLLQTEFYEERKIAKLATLSLNRSKKLLKDKNNFDQKVFLFWLYQQEVLREKDIRRADEKMEAMEANLDEFYACNKLRILCEQVNRQKILKKAESDRDYASEAKYLYENINSDLVGAYYHLFLLIYQAEEAEFLKIKAFVSEPQQGLKKEYLQEFISYLMNFCIRKFNDGDLSYVRHYLDFIRKLEAIDGLLLGGVIGVGRLKNAVLSLHLLEGVDAAQSFIDEYGSKLAERHKPYLLLAQASLDLDKQLLQKAFKGITNFQQSPVYLHDLYYKLTCDKLLLKCYYELGERKAILSRIDGIKAYIRSGRRLPPKRVEKNLNFLHTIERLAKNEFVQVLEIDYTIPDYRWLQKIRSSDR